MSEYGPGQPEQNSSLELEPRVAERLKQLAQEDEISPEELVAKLVEKEDSERHSTWSRKQGEFVRHACPRPGCTEPHHDPKDLAD